VPGLRTADTEPVSRGGDDSRGADICQQLQGLSAGQRRLERKIVRHLRREAMAAAAADASRR